MNINVIVSGDIIGEGVIVTRLKRHPRTPNRIVNCQYVQPQSHLCKGPANHSVGRVAVLWIICVVEFLLFLSV